MPKNKSILRRILRWTMPFVVLLLCAAAYWGYQYQRGNFHAITPGEAYRSAQLDEALLRRYLEEYNIRSVINLRTANDEADWYRNETAICERLGAEHRNVPLSAYTTPTTEQVAALQKLFASLPRPVLIHCRAGADRTGWAATLWKLAVDNSTLEDARGQLSLRYGHFPVGPTSVLDRFYDDWESTSIIQTPAVTDEEDALVAP